MHLLHILCCIFWRVFQVPAAKSSWIHKPTEKVAYESFFWIKNPKTCWACFWKTWLPKRYCQTWEKKNPQDGRVTIPKKKQGMGKSPENLPVGHRPSPPANRQSNHWRTKHSRSYSGWKLIVQSRKKSVNLGRTNAPRVFVCPFCRNPSWCLLCIGCQVEGSGGSDRIDDTIWL